MGQARAKMITGTRLGLGRPRAPREKLSRIRSGIYKLERGLIDDSDSEKYIKGLVAQLRFVHQLSRKDGQRYATRLREATKERFLSVSDTDFLRVLAAQ